MTAFDYDRILIQPGAPRIIVRPDDARVIIRAQGPTGPQGPAGDAASGATPVVVSQTEPVVTELTLWVQTDVTGAVIELYTVTP